MNFSDYKPKPEVKKWFEYPMSLDLLAEYLVHRDNMTLTEFRQVLLKPWNWQDEYKEAKAWQIKKMTEELRQR